MIIAFHTPQIDIRGSCVAIYDYAHYNEKILGNKSIIVVPSISLSNGKNQQIAVQKFEKRFDVFYYTSDYDLENILSNCNIIYYIKYGKNDGFLSKKIKNVIHCVFDLSDPHGEVYAAVSYTLAKKFEKELFVPHIVGLESSKTKENLRDILCIPKDAIVFGYHGGYECFNIDFVKEVVKDIVRERKDIYFVFINIEKFDNHSQILFREKIVDPDDKNKFISTCDAMLHAQKLGETFGLSIAEFSINNKPIITYGGAVWNDTYKNILKEKGIYYTNYFELYNILSNFDKELYKDKDLNCYKEYSPEIVMKKFKEVFID
jgi:hypothetical protein